jgi:hypothetical protein
VATEYAFRDRPPSEEEFRDLVLALSTYRDGSGQQVAAGRSQPGWRDFERATASALGGDCPENKGVFDVVVPVDDGLPYGLSLKTSALKSGFVLMELHNSYAKAWGYLNDRGIDPKVDAAAAGAALIEQVLGWHAEVEAEIDLARSSYVVLTHDRTWQIFQLSWFSLTLDDPDPGRMEWAFAGRRIFARWEDHQWWEWYGESGGQLKYYPPLTLARWVSEPFELWDPPSEETPIAKARRYWPDAFG